MNTMNPITIHEAAAFCGVHHNTVRLAVKAGTLKPLPPQPHVRAILIDEAEVTRWNTWRLAKKETP